MNDRIRKHLIAYHESKGFATGDEEIRETLLYAKQVWRGNREEHRWFDWYDFVVEVDGMLLMYRWCESKSESCTPSDAGEVLNLDNVCEAEPVEITTTVYRRKESHNARP